MTEMHEAVAAVKNLAKQFRGVLQIADVLEDVGALENVRREAEEATAKAVLKRDDRQFQARQADSELKEALEAVEEARADAQHVAQVSKQGSKSIAAQALKKADRIVAEAEVRAQAVDKKTQEAEDAHVKVMDERAGEAAEARAGVDEIEEQLAALRERIGNGNRITSSE